MTISPYPCYNPVHVHAYALSVLQLCTIAGLAPPYPTRPHLDLSHLKLSILLDPSTRIAGAREPEPVERRKHP